MGTIIEYLDRYSSISIDLMPGKIALQQQHMSFDSLDSLYFESMSVNDHIRKQVSWSLPLSILCTDPWSHVLVHLLEFNVKFMQIGLSRAACHVSRVRDTTR